VPHEQGDERRTIEELVTRYLLEPELDDVFVEGPADAALISWFLYQTHRHAWRVYPIETVDIPSELVRERDFYVGARGQFLSLCLELADRTTNQKGRNPVFIVDLDTDSLIDVTSSNCDLCLITDFSSMDMYAFEVKPLDKFLKLFVRTVRVNAEGLINAVSAALVEIFLVRAALHEAEAEIRVIEHLTRCCSRGAAGIEVDTEELARRSINSASGVPRPTVAAIMERVSDLRTNLPEERRRVMLGHDLIHVLSWFLQALGVAPELRRSDVVRRGLVLSLEADDLSNYPMFAELLRRTVA
jgi:hypothetical protein